MGDIEVDSLLYTLQRSYDHTGNLQDFESSLKDVVQAKRLSASKMTKLTDLAMKLMKDDTQLVSILYRTHKSLSAPAKISSLYIFDALARAAKHQANKQNLVGDIKSSQGNCATFLLKVEGVLEGLFQDMVLTGTLEAKEKSKKVLDIWVKGNTFPATILSQLADVLNSKDKVKESTPKPAVSSDPRIAQSSMIDSTPTPPLPSSSNTTASTTGGPQSAILALLTQAANAGASSNQPSTSNPLDVSQLALLQQLTQTAQMGTNVSYPNAGTAPAQSVPPDVNAVRSFYADVSSSRSPSNNRYSSPDGDYRHDSRGAYRGGRGGRGKRDGHFRDREQPSRSKSPQSRYGARREIKPYSPTRRPIVSPREPFDAGKPFQATAEAKNKDEFGRELRAQSTESSEDADSPVGTSRVQQTHTHPTSPPGPRALSQPDLAGQASPGNEQFNMATFDFTDPTAWVTLGKMYEASFGVMPSTEQLMQFVMMAGASMDLSYDSWNQSGNTYMDAQGISTLGGGIQDYSGNHFQGQSSVNGGWNAGGGDPRVQRGGLSETVAGATTESPVAKRGGGMRKVGDKWVFVRETDSGVS